MRATISRGGSVVLQDAEVSLRVSEPPGRLKSWHGSLRLREDQDLEPGGTYDLKLEDGRGGRMLITNVEIRSSGQTHVEFSGAGPLE